ncbi:unnamed protein product [Rotaria magnacalcarata]|nr:unnamed protein product [Rotaria magnacalcarata]
MQYDFTNQSSMTNDLTMEENIHSYPIYQQEHKYYSAVSNNMIPTSDLWQSSLSNSNASYQPVYFPSSVDFNNSNQYSSIDNYNFDYQSSSDISSTHLFDPYSNTLPDSYSIDPYSTQAAYNSTPIESSTYITPTESYQILHPMYTHSNATAPSSTSSSSSSMDIQLDYQSTTATSSWHIGTMKMPSHDVASTPNSSKQPCLVCHEQSSGYHFGAYTCESCKAFYRRVTKDPNIEIKHSCEVPLPNITKSNRKDCRACRKAKCVRVGMTIVSKDRLSRTKTPSKSSSLMPITNLLEQLAYDLTYNQLSTSSALENLLHLLDLPPIITIDFDYHSLYMNAIQIWRNQYNHFSQIFTNISLNDTFAVLLFLFYSLMIMKETNENNSTNNIKFDKLVHILQQEINRITGEDHRLACRIKALFMKCYVALAQYYPNSTNLFNSNYSSQTQSIQ